jgi:GNAT superfamily N-acetyltransferase
LRPVRDIERGRLPAFLKPSAASLEIRVAERDGRIAGWMVWERQPFETDHLGVPAARIVALVTSDSGLAYAELAQEACATLAGEGIAFASLRLGPDDNGLAEGLRASGAQEIERLVTFERGLEPEAHPMPADIGIAGPRDVEACAEVGRLSFAYDRFHRDPAFESSRADALKAEWMRNACRGRAEAVLVARAEDGTVAGCNACLLDREAATIDLIGVLPSHRGRGLGRRLVEGAIARYAGRAKTLRVGTQEDNAASIALYTAADFRPVGIRRTFHLHMRKCA